MIVTLSKLSRNNPHVISYMVLDYYLGYATRSL